MHQDARRALLNLAACVLLPATPTGAWVSSTASSTNPAPAHWDLTDTGTSQPEVQDGEVVYRLHPAGSQDISDGSDLEALRRAFEAWEQVAGSDLAWSEGPAVSDLSIDNDDVFPVFWDEAGQFPLGGALAVTFTYIYTSGPEAGEIVDANVVFNGAYNWSTDATPGTYDVESIAAHEIGHALGLDHSPLGAATLWPYAAAGETLTASLSHDDRAAARAKYPTLTTLTQTGSLTGSVTRSGSPLHGAHVVALDAAGNVAAGTLSLSDGSWNLDALDPGTYALYVEAIGGPRFGTGNLGAYYAGSDTGFPASFDTVTADVVEGLPALVDLTVPAGSAALTPRYVGRTDQSSWSTSVVQVEAGEGIVEVGMAVEGMPMSGSPLTISGQDLPVLSTRFGTVGGVPAALVTIDVHSGVVPGLRTFVVEVGGERARGSGALEILAAPSLDDADGDTVSDSDEGAPSRDTDGDTTPDYLDLDSDDDTISDAEEAGDTDLQTPPVDTDGDMIPDLHDLDSDDDTVLDLHEAGDADAQSPPRNTDGDSDPDYRDVDSDDDGILDFHEAGDGDSATPPVDTDGDGAADLIDDDSDGDTVLDLHEAGDANLATPPRDLDGDGLADFRDEDSDDDTILDLHEAGDSDPLTAPVDSDGDTLRDLWDEDSDGDTILDLHEAGDASPATPPSDRDADTLPDFLDQDSDGDAVLDAHEAGDGDLQTPPRSSDADGIPDFLDPDSDDDGLEDLLEAGDDDLLTPPLDSDGDTLADLVDLDSDADGVADGTAHEDAGDFDGDGAANFRDSDADDGGEPDGSELSGGRDPLDPSDDLGTPPGEVPDGTGGDEPVRVRRLPPTGLALFWDAAPGAASYRVYRGTLGSLSQGVWDLTAGPGVGTCDTQGALGFQDPQETGTGAATYYLVAGLNAAGEGGLGAGTGGNVRPDGPGCSP